MPRGGGAALVTERSATSFPPDFDRVFGAERARVVRHLRYLTGSQQTAEDLAQEAFARLLERESGDDAEAVRDPGAWLLRVASNLAYNHFRAEERRRSREDRASTRVALPRLSVVPGGAEEVLDVRESLARLDARDRAVLMLRHSGFSYAEIAEAIGIAPSSVGTTLARAQRRFREVYEGSDKSSEGKR